MPVRPVYLDEKLIERWNSDATAAADAPNANIPARSVRYYNADGTVASTRAFTAAEGAAIDAGVTRQLFAVNEAALLAKVPTALSTNTTFLGITSPNTTQVTNQVKALTRQVDALLKLRANDLSDTAGT